jgi:DedD protein
MDHELKQRLIGAVVVTALCAIFIPMLFDDPVDNSGQLVSELNIPAPVDPGTDMAGKLPSNAEQVLKSSDPEPLPTEASGNGNNIESTAAAEELPEEADKQESLYAESEGYTREGTNTEEVVEQPIAEVEESQPKPRMKQAPAGQPLSTETDGVRTKTQVKSTRVEPIAQEPVKVKKIADPVKPVIVKKTEAEPLTGSKDIVTKASPLPDPAKQPVIKQPNSAKSLAAAVAEAKKPEVAPKATPKLVRWYIQIGSFSKRENAMSLWDSLREQGLPASLDTVQTDKGPSYRLRVGPELDGKKAAAMKLRLDKQNIKAILVSE